MRYQSAIGMYALMALGLGVVASRVPYGPPQDDRKPWKTPRVELIQTESRQLRRARERADRKAKP